MRTRLYFLIIALLLIIAAIFALFHQPPRKQVSGNENPEVPPPAQQKNETVIRLKALPSKNEHGRTVSTSEDQMRALMDTLVERIDRYGTINGELEILPDQQLELRFPRMDEKQVVRFTDLFSKRGLLSIHEVFPMHNNNPSEAFALAAKVANKKDIIPSYRSYRQYKKNKLGKLVRDQDGKFVIDRHWLVRRKAALINTDIEYMGASVSQPGTVEVRLNDTGAERMRTFTRNIRKGEYIVTVIDGVVVSAAILNAEELGRHFVITGSDSKISAEDLATILINPLPCAVEVISVTP